LQDLPLVLFFWLAGAVVLRSFSFFWGIWIFAGQEMERFVAIQTAKNYC
jgi:hypothetical protein